MISGRGGQMINFDNKYVNFASVIIAVIIILGAVGISSKVYAAPSSNIGTVDFQLLISQHPDMVLAQETMKMDAEQALKTFNNKIVTMKNDQDKQAYFNKLQQLVDERKKALLVNIQDKVIAVVKVVADSKGLAIVVDNGIAIYGGQDITAEVGKKMNSK